MTSNKETDAVEVRGYYNLLALHRILLEAKFSTAPSDKDVAVSPITARLAREVMDCLVVLDRQEPGKASAAQWSEWRQIDESRREWKIAIGLARDRPEWQSLPIGQRREIAMDLLAPFRVTEVVLKKFMLEAGLVPAE